MPKISFEEALSAVRARFKEHYVKSGFDFGEEYIFVIVRRNYKELNFGQCHPVRVNDKGEVCWADWETVHNNPEEYAKASKAAIIIDDIDVFSHVEGKSIWD